MVLLALLALGPVSATPVHAAELVMFDAPWCGRCKQFLAETAPIYPGTPAGRAFPLRVADVQTASGYRLLAPIQGTPTFVLMESGRELARITGYVSREQFLYQADAMRLAMRRPRRIANKAKSRKA